MTQTHAPNFKSTIFACYRGYITQGIVNNLAPLFFVIFQNRFHISYGLISALILCNFVTQVVTDVLAVRYVDRMGFRRAAVAAHSLAFIGLMLMGILPNVLPVPYIGLVIATIVNGVGGGLIEVIISPIVESCPGDAKASAMSLLHSFYCWGQVGVVLITTLLLRVIGEDLWFVIPMLWSFLPFYNLFAFLKVPLMPTVSEDEKTPLKTLFASKIFLVAMLLMLCAGASELAMCQWSSLFAERALGVTKVVGDLLGPCFFAVLMGIGRTIYGVWGEKINLSRALMLCALLCILCYLGAGLFENPILSLLSCALCGLSVSLMWPGTFSLTAAAYPKGGTAMFGVLAVMGDIGCSAGPALMGAVSAAVSSSLPTATTLLSSSLTADQLGLKAGMLFCMLFPALIFIGVALLNRFRRTEQYTKK
ncbi:MFS transporter [Anaeromassilibacillus senegalensis]|uniref:MFS transporter n=1 Tax=Anaeromassilibacillus senegalensis TaxID=1673717 RepID=A0ABS9CPH4_9FIRM|nr:MFS transporter [Anaeromassilibacillus senegalensis]MCF2653051.1 MFS transporter [Anaeromassilibacillus senegalensis]